jgi:ubiquitin-conjugating enzyme (huntingtin interacting protein 2)
MVDFARVQKELVECHKDAEGSGIRVAPKSDNLVNLIGTIPGPTGTPYEGGVFQIEINLPGRYYTKNYSHSVSIFVSPIFVFSIRVS